MNLFSIKTDTTDLIQRSAELLKQNKIIVYPTDTVYGIGGNALNKEVIDKIYKLKNRPRNKPLSIIVKDFSMLKKYCDVSPKELLKIKSYLPGPYTLLLKKERNF